MERQSIGNNQQDKNLKKEIKYAVIIVILLAVFIAVRAFCNIYLFYNPRYTGQPEDRIHNEKILKEILECFDDKDTDRLKAMFSKSVQQKYDLDSQIANAFEIYGSSSVSYEGFFDFGYTSKATSHGKCIEKSVGAEMKNIKTKDNNTYTIDFGKCVVNDVEPDGLGIIKITLWNKDNEKLAVIGSIYDGEIINGKTYKSN